MKFKLTATVSHKSFEKPIVHEFFYEGDSKRDVLDKIDTLPHHIKNLRRFGKAAFKDAYGVKHVWTLSECIN